MHIRLHPTDRYRHAIQVNTVRASGLESHDQPAQERLDAELDAFDPTEDQCGIHPCYLQQLPRSVIFPTAPSNFTVEFMGLSILFVFMNHLGSSQWYFYNLLPATIRIRPGVIRAALPEGFERLEGRFYGDILVGVPIWAFRILAGLFQGRVNMGWLCNGEHRHYMFKVIVDRGVYEDYGVNGDHGVTEDGGVGEGRGVQLEGRGIKLEGDGDNDGDNGGFNSNIINSSANGSFDGGLNNTVPDLRKIKHTLHTVCAGTPLADLFRAFCGAALDDSWSLTLARVYESDGRRFMILGPSYTYLMARMAGLKVGNLGWGNMAEEDGAGLERLFLLPLPHAGRERLFSGGRVQEMAEVRGGGGGAEFLMA